jgi:hypothetical protein
MPSSQPTESSLAAVAEANRTALGQANERYYFALSSNHADIKSAQAALDRADERCTEAQAALDTAIKNRAPGPAQPSIKAMVLASRRRR